VRDEVLLVLEKVRMELKRKRMTFAEVLDLFPENNYRAVLLAWGQLREQGDLKREPGGKYFCEA
jgi:hypothetical protein